MNRLLQVAQMALTRPLIAFSLLFSVAAHAAEPKSIGDWYVGIDDDDLPYMMSINESGGILGKWCSEKVDGCFWILAVKTQCEDLAVIPALVSTPGGAANINLTCVGPHKTSAGAYYRLAFDKSVSLDDIVKRHARLGVAIAAKDEAFRVFRFALGGGNTALPYFESTAATRLEMRRKRSTKDRVL